MKFDTIIRSITISLVLPLVLTVFPLFISFKILSNSVLSETAKRLEGIAATGTLLIDGDLHAKVKGPGEEYEQLKKQMRRITKVNKGIKVVHVYSLRLEKPDEKGNIDETDVCIDSAEPNDFTFLKQEDIYPYGMKYCLGTGMKKAFSGKVSSTSNLYPNLCGVWRTGYAPIITSKGKIDAILCVDGSVLDSDNTISSFLEISRSIIIFSFVLCFVISIYINYKIYQNSNK